MPTFNPMSPEICADLVENSWDNYLTSIPACPFPLPEFPDYQHVPTINLCSPLQPEVDEDMNNEEPFMTYADWWEFGVRSVRID